MIYGDTEIHHHHIFLVLGMSQVIILHTKRHCSLWLHNRRQLITSANVTIYTRPFSAAHAAAREEIVGDSADDSRRRGPQTEHYESRQQRLRSTAKTEGMLITTSTSRRVEPPLLLRSPCLSVGRSSGDNFLFTVQSAANHTIDLM